MQNLTKQNCYFGNLAIFKRCLTEDVKKAAEVVPGTGTTAPPKQSGSIGSMLGEHHRVNTLDKYLLVWMKRFRSVKDVPAYVSRDTMERVRNLVRIRVNLSIAVLCLLGAGAMAYSGKLAAGRGESVQKNNLEWHRRYNEQFNEKKQDK